MNKYRKVMKERETIVKDDEEIRVTAAGSVSAYISRAAKLYGEMEKTYVTVTATGNALTKAVTTVEVIKRRFKGLHQITKLGTQEISDEYEPLEEGLDTVIDVRSVPFVEIKLSKEELDTSDIGYQPPIDESLVTEGSLEDMLKPRGRGSGGGKGKGKGGGKGKKGKGKGKRDDDDSDDEPRKGKGKGKGKGKDDGKGKGKGKDTGKGKSSKGYEYDSYSAPRSKGKGKNKGWNDWGGDSDWYGSSGRKGGGWNDSSSRGRNDSGGWGKGGKGSSKGGGWGNDNSWWGY